MMTYILIIAIIATLILFLEIISYYIITELGFVPLKEFPRLSQQIVNKFKTFDPELGHCPIPESTTYDKDITGKAYPVKLSYDWLGGRKNSFSNHNVAASCFGDSFCQCRGVDDNETFQYFLSKKLAKYVKNFGVGGHGIDQALIRYEKLRYQNLGNLIIVAFSICTIERIIGVYKNYIEYGNFMGIKPRFKLIKNEGGGAGEEDNKLKLIKQPINNSSELFMLRKFKNKIRSIDENYLEFEKNKAKPPYSYFLFKNKKYLSLYLYGTLRNILVNFVPQRYSRLLLSKIHDLQQSTKLEQYAKKNIYFSRLFEQKLNIFLAIVNEFHLKVTEDGRKIIFLFLPDYTNISFINEKKKHYYSKAIKQMQNVYGLEVLDSYNIFHNVDPKIIFQKDNYTGHHTAKGNEMIAEFILNYAKKIS